ncbi:peroxiredoxin [Castellaniella defragrans]|jgi:peroxiredoxin Q/BCP|uniref:thioredoxin-dependent peroxiredoxin n=1 Tax=Castellaniella defragrans TaxID=75697 RepID=A0A7W9TSD0_CASDE|nr:peroxiredoxin [Castellaniella defragrans]KAB0603068.1 peroxiredoxin [Castellaniella defragrans]MBB6085108.1 peroxiredoxin Q/BCP [Castellaniella defragrans]
MTPIAIGRPLPPLTAETTQGSFDSAALHGKPFVLYFYPKDNTPGCTTEAQDFRDRHAQFLALDCQIFGISRDTLKSHQGFADKQCLPFPLIADSDEALCALFGVMKQKNMYGKQVRGIERSTFLVDRQGVLVQEWRGVRVPGHADEVLQAAQNLAA